MGKAIGIDFGTTNTVVSYMNKNGHLRQLDYQGETLIPSIIYFKTKDEYVIGYPAKNASKTSPSACVDSFKTKLGADKFTYKITAKNSDTFRLTPKKAVMLFLNKVIKDVEQKLVQDFGTDEGVIDRVVITVPAKFNSKEIEAIKNAASDSLNLGNNKIRAVFEPTAAAIAAQEEEGGEINKVLIYDLGGGTFDVSLIQRYGEKNRFRSVLPADGNKELGGNLLTEMLANKLMQWANEEYGTEFTMDLRDYDSEEHGITKEQYEQNISKVKSAAEDVKIELSDSEETTADFNFWISKDESENASISVTRKELEKIIKKKIDETVEITYKMIHAPAAEALNGIDKIVLAGGSSKIPIIKDFLVKKLNRDDISCSEEVSTLISRGAAILAQDISKLDDIEQVTNFQIGIAATEGMHFDKFQMIIPENVKLPYKNSRDFSLAYDGQQRLDVAYYEYDVGKYPKSKSIDEEGFQQIDVLRVSLPEGLKKSDTVVKITFNANVDGSLDLSAEIFDKNGKKIDVAGGALHVDKESDLI